MGVVVILTVDAYSGVEICTPIFQVRLAINVGGKSFLKKNKAQMDTSLKKATQTRVTIWKIFGSGRNVYVVEESFYFHSTPINLKIKVQQD
jgi:hypothetical protein